MRGTNPAKQESTLAHDGLSLSMCIYIYARRSTRHDDERLCVGGQRMERLHFFFFFSHPRLGTRKRWWGAVSDVETHFTSWRPPPFERSFFSPPLPSWSGGDRLLSANHISFCPNGNSWRSIDQNEQTASKEEGLTIKIKKWWQVAAIPHPCRSLPVPRPNRSEHAPSPNRVPVRYRAVVV